MNVSGRAFRTIWRLPGGREVQVIDQRRLPHEFVVLTVKDVAGMCRAISEMVVRGAPLIGAAAAYGLALAMKEDASDAGMRKGATQLLATRPTAVNLRWAVERMQMMLTGLSSGDRIEQAFMEADRIAEEDVETCSAIGSCGLAELKQVMSRTGKDRLNILTHCNAGWLATVDWGTALSPIYKAHRAGIPLHVWVDETRPRNQGASLTAWELMAEGVPCTLIPDNTGGHLMQQGHVDVCIVGTDRTTAKGDVCNKIGTYLKALAAADNNVPFFVALPSSTIDWRVKDGMREIPIEQRPETEVTHITGRAPDGRIETISIAQSGCRAANYGFDVTPARLVTGLITERGVCEASAEGLAKMFPDQLAQETSQGHDVAAQRTL